MTTATPAAGERPRRGGYALSGVALRGVVCAVPGEPVPNAVIAETLGDQAVADVVKMVGVETRHWAAPDQTSADLCAAAAERLLETLG